MNTKLVFVFQIISFGLAYAGVLDFYCFVDFVGCKGPDAGNYTAVLRGSGNPLTITPSGTLIKYDAHGKPIATIAIENLAINNLPEGANNQYESLSLLHGGPLDGKWLIIRIDYLSLAYLKKMSSVLGLGYSVNRNTKIMIADKLDPNVLISPLGAFEAFKKCATTICDGASFVV